MGFTDIRARRLWAATALALVATVGGAGGAVADEIYNNLDATIDATAEIMPLNVGGSDGTTVLAVQPRNGDSKNGCNFGDGSDQGVLTVSVASSDAGVATAALTDNTFASCGETVTVTIHPVAVGSTTITVNQVSNTTPGSFDLAPATFTVNVSGPSNTAPSIVVAGVDNAASYAKDDVPEATCQVTDLEDGPSSFAATLTGTLDADGLGTQTASCTYTDAGGLTAAESKTYSIIDPSAPGISYTLDPANPDGLDSWYRSAVTLTWLVSEPDSPSSLTKTGCVDQTITADQLATSYSCSASSSGGSAGPVSVSVKRDGNGPSVAYTSASPAAPNGANGWYVSPVTATFTATDGFSGPASQTGTATSSSDGSAVVLDSPTFSDNAGNTTAAGAAHSPAFKIDTVAPDAPTFVGGPAQGSSHYFGSVPGAPTCTSSDATSLLASCVVTGWSGAVGEHTLTATATDNAGNTSAVTRTYTVLAWTTQGFYRPVDMGGVLNTVKGGSTVPLKFELFAGPAELTDTAAIASFTTSKVACDGTAPTDTVELLATGGTSLRYDATAGQFVQNWKTPTGAGTCYRATMTAQDGSAISALFKIK